MIVIFTDHNYLLFCCVNILTCLLSYCMFMFEIVHIAPYVNILLYPKRNNKLIDFLKTAMLVNLLNK